MVIANGGSASRSEINAWTLPDGKRLFVSQDDQPIEQAAISPDGKLLASSDSTGKARIWDAATGKSILLLKKSSDDIKSLAFSPDGRRLALGGQDGTVRLWDLAKNEADAKLAGNAKGAVQALLFTPDGKKLATAGDGTVRFWDVATGKEIFATMNWDTGKRGLASTPDGKLVAIARRTGVMMIESTTGKRVRGGIDYSQREVTDVAFMPDGKTLAVVCNPFLSVDPTGVGEVHLYDLASGKFMTKLRSPRGFLLRLAVTADGKHIVAGGHDGQVHVWQRTATPKAPKVTSVVLDPKDRIGVLVRDLARSGRTNEQCIDSLFLALLGRFPQEAERKTIASFIEKAADRESAFKDVVFQLTHTKEFGDHVKELQQHQPKP
jgi:WD40 repeat protein